MSTKLKNVAPAENRAYAYVVFVCKNWYSC
jgi:hypothetical protein